MNKILFAFAIFIITFEYDNTTAFAQDSRIWTSKSGATIEASVINIQGNDVVLRKLDGVTVKIDRSGLSPQDNEYLQSLSLGKSEVGGKISTGIGIKLSGNNLYCNCSYTISTELPRIKQPIIMTAALVKRGNTSLFRYKGPPESQNQYGATEKEFMDSVFQSKKRMIVDATTVQYNKIRNEKIKTFRVDDNSDVLLWRIELWCDGVLLDVATDATAQKLKALSISEDWHLLPGAY